jgi:two-component system OmpR family response regulator
MKKILVVDDEVALTRMVKRSLEQTGRFKVRTENQGSAAIAAAKDFQPDLIFLDVMMPDLQGDEVAAAIDEEPTLRGTPYVFLTAIVTRDETEATDGEIGGKLFLAKPVKLQDMLDTINRLLGA